MINKKIKIIFGYIAILTMFVNQLYVPMAVLAQEVEINPTPTLEPTLEPTLTPTATPTPTEEVETIDITPTPTEELEIKLGELEEFLAPTATPTASLATESASLTPIDEIIIVIPKETTVNVVDIVNNNDSTANSGGNETTDSQKTEINSGDAIAVANVINVVNTNIETGNIGIYVVDLIGEEEEKMSLDLNQIWELSNQTGLKTLTEDDLNGYDWLNIFFNQVSVDNQVNVVANSGMNIIGETEDAYIFTGNATAIANILNIVNTDFFNSNVFFGIINIDGASLGNIILPRPEMFLENQSQESEAINLDSNMVNIDNNSISIANSGENEIAESNKSSIVTGNSLALSNNLTMVNMGSVGGDMFYFNLNTTGQVNGYIYNWNSPGTMMNLSQFVNIFGIGMGGENGGGNQSLGFNLIDISNNTTAIANSGLNQVWANGTSEIVTGNASSIVNTGNFVNLSLFNNNWFYGLVNVVGNWSGNIIFAYPDLTIGLNCQSSEVHDGEKLVLNVDYFNNGYDESQETTIELTLPAEFNYVSDNSGFAVKQKGRHLSWPIDSVIEGQGGGFEVVVEVRAKDNLAGLIKQVWAADNVEVETESVIVTNQPESDMNNNFASTKTNIIMFDNEFEDNQTSNNDKDDTDTRQPIITIDAKNNVNNFVYTGDVVMFEVDVKNDSDVSAYNAYLISETYDQDNYLQRYDEIYIGEIGAYKEGKVNFGMPVSSSMGTGRFETVFTIVARAKNDNEIESNSVLTSFDVRSSLSGVSVGKGQVLAQSTFFNQETDNDTIQPKDMLPYVLLFLISSGWMYKQARIWSGKQTKNRKFFEIGWFVVVISTFVYSLISIVNKN